MEWTIIRPGGLKNDEGTGNGLLTEDSSICGAISREDVADLVIKALFSDKANNKASPILHLPSLCTVQAKQTSHMA